MAPLRFDAVNLIQGCFSISKKDEDRIPAVVGIFTNNDNASVFYLGIEN